MTLEEKHDFEETFSEEWNNKIWIRDNVLSDEIWQWIETKIDEACKKARIDENQKWINSEYHSRFKGILRHEFSNRIIELSKPSPKESE